jgi:hypothetical protein
MDSYDLEIYQGSTYSLNLILKDGDDVVFDLTDYNISGFLKFRYADANTLVSLNPIKNAPYASGSITLNIPATGTRALPVSYCFYDVEIHHTGIGTVEQVLRGKASIFPEITY